MRKKRFWLMLLTAVTSGILLMGCSSPVKESNTGQSQNVTSAGSTASASKGSTVTEEKSTASTSAERSKATIVDADKLPVKGIGADITSSIKAKENYKIGYIAKNTTNPYMVAQSEGVKKAGADMGFTAVTQAPSTADSVEEQVKIMEDMIQQGMNVIIVHCADSNGIMPGVRKAQEAGIIVLTIGTPAAEDTFLRTGVDYYETGHVIAKSMAEKLNGKGKIIILEGPPGAANAIESGEMFATYNTDPYGSGYIACSYAVNYLNDKTEPEGRFIPFPTASNDPLITLDTVANYKEKIAWWKIIQ